MTKIGKFSTDFPESVCGVDEVGRGCLAGPLVSVAALFYSWDTGVEEVDDSKKISAKKREKIFKKILHSPRLIDFGIGIVSVEEINDMGIHHANVLAFSRSVQMLPQKPKALVVDGTVGVPGWGPQNMLVEPKADGNYPVVSAASILAKVIRDSHMQELSALFPHYCWNKNKGYGTKDHTDALRQYGGTIHHRRKFISNFVTLQTGMSL